MMHAHLISSVEPGTYNDELNRALKLNNLPLIILPSNSPSKKIPNLNDNQHDPQGHQTTKAQQPTPNNTSMPHQSKTVQIEESQQATNNGEERMTSLERITGQVIGLQLISSQTEPWPKGETLSLGSF